MMFREGPLRWQRFSGSDCLGWEVLAQQQTPVPDAPTPQAPTALPGRRAHHAGNRRRRDAERPGGSSSNPTRGPARAAPSAAFEPAARRNSPPPNAQDTAAGRRHCRGQHRDSRQVTEVVVPVTVKDTKGNPVAGLTWRDFTVYENNVREPLRVFSVDPRPMSVAFVIDQTLPSNYMQRGERVDERDSGRAHTL